MSPIKLSLLSLFCALATQAQLAVTVSPVKVVGQKAIVPLALTNDLAGSVESARAVCFLLDEQGQMVGQSAQWVIGGTKDRPALPPKAGTTFNFVINCPRPLPTTNRAAKVILNRLILADGKLADVTKEVHVTTR